MFPPHPQLFHHTWEGPRPLATRLQVLQAKTSCSHFSSPVLGPVEKACPPAPCSFWGFGGNGLGACSATIYLAQGRRTGQKNRAEEGRAGQRRAEQDRGEQRGAEPGREGQRRSKVGRAGQRRAEHGRGGQSRAEGGRAGQTGAEPGRGGQRRAEQDGGRQSRAEQGVLPGAALETCVRSPSLGSAACREVEKIPASPSGSRLKGSGQRSGHPTAVHLFSW